MAIERIAQQGRSGNGSGSTGASWGTGVVQASDVGRLMIATILHESVASPWTASWRSDGTAGSGVAFAVEESFQLSNGMYFRMLVLENPAAATAAGANVHLGGTSCRFLGYTAYYRNVMSGLLSTVRADSAAAGQADPKTLGGIVSGSPDLVVSTIGITGLRNGTPVSPVSDEGNYQQNGTGTDTSMDVGHLAGGADDEVVWNYGASAPWASGAYVLGGPPPAGSAQAVLL